MSTNGSGAARQLRVSGQTVTAQYVADFLHVPLSHVIKVADRQMHARQGMEWAMFLREAKDGR